MSLSLQLNLGLNSLKITGMVFLKQEGFGQAGVLEVLAELASGGKLSWCMIKIFREWEWGGGWREGVAVKDA